MLHEERAPAPGRHGAPAASSRAGSVHAGTLGARTRADDRPSTGSGAVGRPGPRQAAEPPLDDAEEDEEEPLSEEELPALLEPEELVLLVPESEEVLVPRLSVR